MSGIHSTPEPFGFIQARLSSTRLNGKILECIPEQSNQTLLDHIYLRLRRILPQNRIVFLIPPNESSLERYLTDKGYLFFKGSLENVRDRYIKAAEFFNAKHIIRLTGDNPFIDITSIELLWEAMFYIKEKNYCLSIQGLPLGMGVECFSYSALIHNLDKYNEIRHQEHVSLHIKEDLIDNTVYRLIPPHLSDREISKSANLRMTIDTELDLRLLRDVWSHLGEENPYFGAKEVISLFDRNPGVFLTNSNVEQIRFNLPSVEKNKKQISLCYGDPILFGSGHFERCKSLSIELQIAGYDVHCNPELEHQFDGYIVDAREKEISGRPLLSIDNNNISDPEIKHVKFLLHPEFLNQKNSELSFYSSPIIELQKSKTSKPGQWLVYLGSLEKSISDDVDAMLLEHVKNKWGAMTLIRVGGAKPITKEILYYPRLTKYEYYEILGESEGFLSYFGQSIMEALYLRKRTVLFGMSEIHKKLGQFLASEYNLVYIGEPGRFGIPSMIPTMSTQDISRNAQNQILEWLKTI